MRLSHESLQFLYHTHSPIHRELTRGLASCQNHSATAVAKPTISSGRSPFAAALLRAMHRVLFLARLCFVERFKRSKVARCHCLRLITLRDSLFLHSFISRPCTSFALNSLYWINTTAVGTKTISAHSGIFLAITGSGAGFETAVRCNLPWSSRQQRLKLMWEAFDSSAHLFLSHAHPHDLLHHRAFRIQQVLRHTWEWRTRSQCENIHHAQQTEGYISSFLTLLWGLLISHQHKQI